DRKVYSITAAGRVAFVDALLKPLPEERHRSPFMFAMLFSHLMPKEHVEKMLDDYIRQSEGKLAQLMTKHPETPGERFVTGLGRAAYIAMVNFMNAYRAENRAAEAAE